MTQFALSGLAVVVLLGFASAFVLSRLGRSEAIRDARAQTELAGKAVIEPNLTPGIVAGRPAALAALDRVVRSRLLGDKIVRVKLWAPSGRIVYSDERRLIGKTYRLPEDERSALASDRVAAELSDLSRPENRYERSPRKLLEVYLPLSGPNGQKLLYEQYLRFSSIAANSRAIWLSFLPALIAALVLLELVQIPLAWSLARRLREGQLEREDLLRQAIDSSNAERRRIAGDLHDGVVQDLAGISFGLAALAERLGRSLPAEALATLRGAAQGTRDAMRRLRSLLVEIHPPNLHATGLEPALSDLLAPAGQQGLRTSLDVAADVRLPPEIEALLFRAAQEAIRNALEHANASELRVSVSKDDHAVALEVEDDGRGFTEEEVGRRRLEGHLGLALLADLAASADGRLDVDSRPGTGTRLRLELPTS